MGTECHLSGGECWGGSWFVLSACLCPYYRVEFIIPVGHIYWVLLSAFIIIMLLILCVSGLICAKTPGRHKYKDQEFIKVSSVGLNAN